MIEVKRINDEIMRDKLLCSPMNSRPIIYREKTRGLSFGDAPSPVAHVLYVFLKRDR